MQPFAVNKVEKKRTKLLLLCFWLLLKHYHSLVLAAKVLFNRAWMTSKNRRLLRFWQMKKGLKLARQKCKLAVKTKSKTKTAAKANAENNSVIFLQDFRIQQIPGIKTVYGS